MQTILGAGGPIGEGLARELRRSHTQDIRLVSRHPHKVHEADQLVAADLTDREATAAAVEGSDTVYFTAGLPMDSALWERQFPPMIANVIAACERHGARLVFFDNTYMYPRTSLPQTEETPFEPVGRKSVVRARIATRVLDAMGAGRIEVLIGRAPEFYGPGRTQSLTNSLVFSRIRGGKWPLVPVSAHTRRSLIWTPDASRALALLGNTDDAFGQTWHLPIDPDRQTYAELIGLAAEALGRRIPHVTVPKFVFRAGARVNPVLREVEELLPRYGCDNIFESAKFAARFPDFRVTRYREGIAEILEG